MLCVLIRSASQRHFNVYPQYMYSSRNKKKHQYLLDEKKTTSYELCMYLPKVTYMDEISWRINWPDGPIYMYLQVYLYINKQQSHLRNSYQKI